MAEFPYKCRRKQSDAPRESVCENEHSPFATIRRSSAKRKVCFSFAAYACTVIEHLSNCNIPITKGLSKNEFQRIQSKFGFNFPPDLQSILQEGLPVGMGFPNWRSSSDIQLLSMINLPAKGLCHEVSKGTFWCKHWGPRPDSIDDAVCVARKAFKLAPVLVPIYSYCYIPCFPNLSGNPILFVFEKDVFYCGYDLADFFEREVFIPLRSSDSQALKTPEWDATDIPGPIRPKQQIMSSINEELAMESKLKLCYNKEDGFLPHGYIHDGRHDSQTGNPHQYGLSKHTKERLHWSVKQVDREMVDQRLLAELQNADADDQWSHERERIGAGHGEGLSRKSLCEEPLCPFERPPKSLVRSAGSSPRMGEHIMSRYAYFHDKPLPAEVLAQFTIAAPPWTAKMARHIPMWSELVENKESLLHGSNVERIAEFDTSILRQSNLIESKVQTLCDAHGVQSTRSIWDLNVAEGKESVHESSSVSMEKLESIVKLPKHVKRQEEQGAHIGRGKPSKRWLVPYFKDMEKRLRRGGWKEDEIEEMMVAALPSNDEILLHKKTGREIQDALDTSANAMSLSLQKAGWSVPDVLEILSLDLKHPERMHVSNMAKNATPFLKSDKKMAGKLSDFLSKVPCM